MHSRSGRPLLPLLLSCTLLLSCGRTPPWGLDGPPGPDSGIAQHGWAVRTGGFKYNAPANSGPQGTGLDIVVDQAGYSTVAGYFVGSADFGKTTLTAHYGASKTWGIDDYITRIGPNGQFIWAQAIQGTENQAALALALDPSGQVLAAGRYWDVANFGNTRLNATNGFDIFVSRMNQSGQFLGATSSSGPGTADAWAIDVDGRGDIYITGTPYNTMNLGPFKIAPPPKGGSILVAKLNSKGTFIWATQATHSQPATYLAEARAIKVDSQGNSFITGAYDSPMTFGKTTLPDLGDPTMFVAKLSPDGKFLWAKSPSDDVSSAGSDLALDGAGNSYIAGSYSTRTTLGTTKLKAAASDGEEIFVTKVSPTGDFLWATSAGGPGKDYGTGIEVDSAGNSFIAGTFVGRTTFGPITLTSQNAGKANSVFLARLDAQGKFKRVISGGGKYGAVATALARSSSGDLFMTGQFRQTATFGKTTLTAKGRGDTFVWKVLASEL